MKRIITLVLLVFSLNLSAQSHVLDFSFGENLYNGVNFTPTNVWLINGSYYLMNSSQILKLNYDGTLNTAFGPNGLKTITLPSNVDNGSLQVKSIDNNFYVLGSVTVSNNKNIFITKLGLDGLPDTTFGINGTAIVDLGNNESISDFIIDVSGKFLCTGTKSGNSTRLIYFRINSNGTLDTTLNTQGYYEYVTNDYSAAGKILQHQNNLLLIGTDTKYIDSVRYEELYLVNIDYGGNLISNFGINGSKIIPLYGGMTISVRDVQIFNNNLYAEYFYAWSFNTQGTKIINYDLSQNQVIFNNETYYTAYFQANTGGYYIAGIDRCNTGPCTGHYFIKKYNVNGTINTNFNSGNVFTYNFPGLVSGFSNAKVICADNSDTIFIAGYTQGYFNGTVNNGYKAGFSAIRLIPTALSAENFNEKQTSLYPNPFTDKFTISGLNDLKSVEVYDITGRLIGKPAFVVVDGKTIVDMAFAQAGNYFLKIEALDGKISTHKIIKQ